MNILHGKMTVVSNNYIVSCKTKVPEAGLCELMKSLFKVWPKKGKSCQKLVPARFKDGVSIMYSSFYSLSFSPK